ncbi:hypothetical protein BpHYR1_032522 [Brachionus plicatilis]|uniref:Uncharacterized protein n=1 Tax=Brachionus plicatilis TaxID=10195 RepID=A0A3M7Q4N1_BRAPC|nr:hypothetical protein BpHYR1_032522 [Brachionus plicatilis]
MISFNFIDKEFLFNLYLNFTKPLPRRQMIFIFREKLEQGRRDSSPERQKIHVAVIMTGKIK